MVCPPIRPPARLPACTCARMHMRRHSHTRSLTRIHTPVCTDVFVEGGAEAVGVRVLRGERPYIDEEKVRCITTNGDKVALIKKAWDPDPAARPAFADIVHQLEKPASLGPPELPWNDGSPAWKRTSSEQRNNLPCQDPRRFESAP